jgi:hypothetical protein
LGVYWLFLVLCRPYDDTIFQTFEIITNTAQLAMLIVIILGYFELISAPAGAFIGLIAFVLLGQIGIQVCCDDASAPVGALLFGQPRFLRTCSCRR